MPDPDVVVIGGGHNGLIAAAYLAKAGLRPLVLERRTIPGGCTATEEMAPGVWISRCHCDHALLYTTPIPDELALAQYGLEHVSVDPVRYAPRLNDQGLVFWQDVERTAEEIGRRNAKDARAYRTFITQWTELFQWMQPLLCGDPTPRKAARRMLRPMGRFLGGLRRLPLLQRAQRASMRDLLDATFEDMHLKGALALMTAGMLGQSPAAPGSATSATVAAVQLTGTRRPRGGSGALPRALVQAIEAHGGAVRTGAQVDHIEVAENRVRAVRLQNGDTIETATVIAACHPATTFLDLLDHQAVPAEVRGAIERLEIANGFTLKADYVIDRLPEWIGDSASPDVLANASAIICPSLEYLEIAHADYVRKRSPRWPALMVTAPTAADPDLCRDGLHILTVEGRYFPYQLDGGVSWHSLQQEEGERLYKFLYQYAPNLEGAEQLRIVQTPESLELELGLPRGHPSHLDAGPGQSLHRRPIPQLANYRTPIRGLYLSGAGTHPGGGVWGLPGRNTAHEVMADLA